MKAAITVYLILAFALAASAAPAARSRASASAQSNSTATSVNAAVPTAAKPLKPIRIIPTVGIASMGVKGDAGQTLTGDTGAAVGALVDLGQGPLVFETGLLFAQMGGRATMGFGSVSLNLDYLAIPFLAKFYLPGGSERSFFLKGGLMPAFLASKRISTTLSPAPDIPIRSNDVFALAGLGGSFPLSARSDLVLEGSYLRGLSNISGAGGAARNEGFLASAGVSLGF